jgi:hypothetical protein
MQKKHAKGFFLNSSYRKTRTLKSLLRNQQDQGPCPGEAVESPPHPDFSSKSVASSEDPQVHTKKAVSI